MVVGIFVDIDMTILVTGTSAMALTRPCLCPSTRGLTLVAIQGPILMLLSPAVCDEARPNHSLGCGTMND